MLICTSKNYISSNISKKTKGKRSFSQKISFGKVKMNTLAEKPCFFNKAGMFFKKTYHSVLKKEIGQNTSNLINYAGKAIISPLMIFAIAPFTNENKESIKHSALLHPIQAVLSFATAMGSSIIANNILDNKAKKGTLGNFIDPELGKFFNSATKIGKENLSKLKNISTLFLTVVAIPITGILLNTILPKLIQNHETKKNNKTGNKLNNENRSKNYKRFACFN